MYVAEMLSLVLKIHTLEGDKQFGFYNPNQSST